MDEVTLNLVKFALDMHTIKQQVASKNIANVDFKNKQTVDFSHYVERLDGMTDTQKLNYLSLINSNPSNLQNAIETEYGTAISIEAEHADSTKAMLEYQALIEALNRKLSIKALVMGGNR